MRSTFKVLFYLKRDKVKKNGDVPLLRLILDRCLCKRTRKRVAKIREFDEEM